MYKNHTIRRLATGIENYPNIDAPTAAYPKGNIKDNDGSMNGTPFNVLVYADIHQLLDKFLRAGQVTPSGDPENETNGFQYLEAMKKVLADPGEIVPYDRTSSLGQVNNRFNPYIEIDPLAPDLGDIGLDAISQQEKGKYVSVANRSVHSCDIFPDGLETINGAASYVLPAGAGVKLKPSVSGTDWKIIETF